MCRCDRGLEFAVLAAQPSVLLFSVAGRPPRGTIRIHTQTEEGGGGDASQSLGACAVDLATCSITVPVSLSL